MNVACKLLLSVPSNPINISIAIFPTALFWAIKLLVNTQAGLTQFAKLVYEAASSLPQGQPILKTQFYFFASNIQLLPFPIFCPICDTTRFAPTLEFKELQPYDSLSKAYVRLPLGQDALIAFRNEQLQMLAQLEHDETEEHAKTYVRDFLRAVWYNQYEVNTRKDVDLVIHSGSKADSEIGVMLEAKRPANKAEFPKNGDLRCKALYELLYYYLHERSEGSNQIANLVITNGYEWYFLDEKWFAENAWQNRKLLSDFEHYAKNRKTHEFYREIATPFFNSQLPELPYVRVDFREYAAELNRHDFESLEPAAQRRLTMLYKLFSPQHLLKLNFLNTGNTLDTGFYGELLHILGLEEITDSQTGKLLITRLPLAGRSPGSLLENTITHLRQADFPGRLANPEAYGQNAEDSLLQMAIELVITWLNRILFLKLLEAQLLRYHSGDIDKGQRFAFLSPNSLSDFSDLNRLFFSILAVRPEDRDKSWAAFAHIPYLNSSLFEATETEQLSIRINSLDSKIPLSIHSATVLKDADGKRLSGKGLPSMQYLLSFLDAYDFSSEGGGEVRKDSKTLVSAKVLGLIFEKINGYADGSVYTPGYITEYMCRETIRQCLLSRLNDAFKLEANDWQDVVNWTIQAKLYKDRELRYKVNSVINSLKICDPAVGSGHFLVSALNELIAIKSDLGVLSDEAGHVLPVNIEVSEDELVITERSEPFTYTAKSTGNSLRIQKALFHEKQMLIEGCLFGVDINPNSVKICRLRLWIELLKQAYYENGALQTFPNIDINIKEGNSLLYKFPLGLVIMDPKLQRKVNEYSTWVAEYKNTTDRDRKRGLNQLLKDSLSTIGNQMQNYDRRKMDRQELAGKLDALLNTGMFETQFTTKQQNERNKQIAKLEAQINAISEELRQEESGFIYRKAFEWRFAFPEVLNEDGNFEGFDMVIGNPPYIRQEDLGDLKMALAKHYKVYAGTADIYQYFFELGLNLLKPNGLMCYIVANKWMLAGYGEALRRYLAHCTIHQLIDFGDLKVFDAATTYPCIIRLSAHEPAQGHQFPFVKAKTLKYETNLSDYVNQNLRLSTQSDLSVEGWNISDSRTHELILKIKTSGIPLGSYVNGNIIYGIKSGFNEAFVIDAETYRNILSENPKSAEIIKPFLTGKDIKRYVNPVPVKYLIFTRRGIDIDRYPAVKKYLEQFRERLEPRPKHWDIRKNGKWKGRKNGTYKWFEIQDAVDYWKEFNKPKIIYQRFQTRPEFVLDINGSFVNDAIYSIIWNEKWLVAILNSKLGWFQIGLNCTQIQNGYQLLTRYFEKVTIAIPDSKMKNKLGKLVDKVTKAKASNLDTTHLEAEIDALVYQLYCLSEEEIKIVEER